MDFDFGLLFALFVVLAAIIVWLRVRAEEVEQVVSRTDGRTYLVRRLPDSQEAADRLGRINQDSKKLLEHLSAKFPKNAAVQRLVAKYNPDAISEGSPNSGYTSYSINKGEKLVICIRQSDLSFVDHNITMYVVVHELGHLMTKSVGHTKEFWAKFRFILRQAMAIGLYRKVDFDKKAEDYCSIKITSSVV